MDEFGITSFDIRVAIVSTDECSTLETFFPTESDVHIVYCLQSGDDVFDECTSSLPDIVFIDRNLTEIDALKLLAQLRAALPSVGIIMLSYNNDMEWIRQCLKLGADNFITKPITKEEVYTELINAYHIRK
jgi:DNA-binding NarL/FixJ family response regulator